MAAAYKVEFILKFNVSEVCWKKSKPSKQVCFKMFEPWFYFAAKLCVSSFISPTFCLLISPLKPGKWLLYPTGRVQSGQSRLPHLTQLPYVQNVLLPLWRDAGTTLLMFLQNIPLLKLIDLITITRNNNCLFVDYHFCEAGLPDTTRFWPNT